MEDTKKLIEKYKRELMELSRTSPAKAPEQTSAETDEVKAVETEQTGRSPKIIGYVTDDGESFPAVFDKYITEAVESNEIERVNNSTDDTPFTFDDMDEPRGNVTTVNADNDDNNNDDNDDVIAVPPDLFDKKSGDPEDDAVPAKRDMSQSEMEHGSGESISNFPVSEYSTEEEFEARNTGGGMLEFRVFSANQALPVEGAEIVVTTYINDKEQRMFRTMTNSSGETETFTLPAPSKELSQNSANKVQPFSLYNAVVEKPGYTKVILRDIPIFDGVLSIQRVAMLPESENDENAPAEEITEVPNAK